MQGVFVLRRVLAAFLVALLPAASSAQQSSRLKVLVLEGENATHNLKRKAVSPTVIEVRDERNKPVGGAVVRFKAPERGPGGWFGDGDHISTVYTDANGQAALTGFVPNDREGTFSLAVLASYGGREGETFINQENAAYERAAPAAPPPPVRRSGVGRKLLIVVAAGAAAAAAGVIAVGGRGGGASSSSAPPTTVDGGGVIVGGPR